ncbi:MAG TPA: nicotinate phosphoribosyltransferase [Planctomycetota bacterium]|nr:nicotinate phosphoribosyltransferase [Planctomycetota bacterium]
MDHGALLTDLYQLTMAYGYWKEGRAEREAVFTLSFRKHPFAGGYAIACGLAPVLDWLERFRFEPAALQYLASLTGNDGKPLFERGFLDHLGALRLTLDIDAMPEGTVAFAHQPLLRVRGPILQGQLVETALLCLINFDTLIATKAARVAQAAGGDAVLEFGLRRAQGGDGALAASRAAHIGGCAATSNVLAGMRYGIPVRGTHAHSWVMSFADEPEAFAAYARAMPNNCVFLVDTYDTLDGVRHAIEVGRALRAGGHEMVGIRLDSGDLAWLSIEARRLLDAAGFPRAQIVASNDLDERLIASLKQQGARIAVWGVGTKLVTAYDQPALGGVYKLGAIRADDGAWRPCVKLSEQAAKVSTPGLLQARRFTVGDAAVGDVVWDELAPTPAPPWTMVDPGDATRRKRMPADAVAEDLLVPALRRGARVLAPEPIAVARERRRAGLARFHDGIKRFDHPHQYPVGLELGLHERRTALILGARERVAAAKGALA